MSSYLAPLVNVRRSVSLDPPLQGILLQDRTGAERFWTRPHRLPNYMLLIERTPKESLNGGEIRRAGFRRPVH